MPDVNVLVAALQEQVPYDTRAREVVETGCRERAPVGLAWVALTGFIRVSTRCGIFERPLGVEQALQAVDHWLNYPAAVIVNPGSTSPRSPGSLADGSRYSGQTHNRCSPGCNRDRTQRGLCNVRP